MELNLHQKSFNLRWIKYCKCVCKQDDILIDGNDEIENLDIREMLLERFSENNVHINLPKCYFLTQYCIPWI